MTLFPARKISRPIIFAASLSLHVYIASTIMAVTSRVIVYGGKGALGSVIVNYFKSKNWVSEIKCACEGRRC